MKQIDKQRLAERGHGGIVLVSAVAAAGGLPYMANDSATKAYALNLGEALHVELRQAGGRTRRPARRFTVTTRQVRRIR